MHRMVTHTEIPLISIRVGERLRKADPGRVAAIAASIEEIGLQTPIHVTESAEYADGERLPIYRLVAGLHRLAAVESLRHATIAAAVVDMNEVDSVLWECDENLARAELSDVARARFTAKRKLYYEIKHPETRAGALRAAGMNRSLGHDVAAKLAATSFVEDTATKTGNAARTIRRDARRGEKIAPDVLDKIEGTEHDSGVVLDQLAKLEPKEQRRAVKNLEAGKPLPTATPKQSDIEFGRLIRAFRTASLEAQERFRQWVSTKAAASAA